MASQWVEIWSEDIEQLKLELPQLHKNLYFSQNKSTFYKKLKELKSKIENYDHYMIIVSIAQIVASFRDAHTSLIIPASKFMPFVFFWFEEGIYIVDSSDKYREYINCKVTHIDGKPISDVIQLIASIISYENNWFLMSQMPRYLSACEVLYGLEIIHDLNQVELTVESLDKEIKKFETDIFQEDEYKGEIIRDDDSSKNNIPLYRKNSDRNFWSYFIEESNTLYFCYNYCKNMEDVSVESFCSELIDFINENDVRKLVIDIRNNPGGNSTLLEPFIGELRKCKKLNKAGGIFVIIGRGTFSSALINAYSLKNKTSAIFIGEASGGKPNCYGEVKYFDLMKSNLKIRYSTEYYKIIKDNKQLSLFPQIPIEVSFKNYLENRDPCMEFILNYVDG